MRKQAERRARKLWPRRGVVAVQEWARESRRYAVGYVGYGGMFMPMGQAPTWEAAFDAATERNERIKEATS